MHVLITGGAGFIGSHLADQLLTDGYRVRVLDALTPQVHGSVSGRPAYLSEDVELVMGDVRDAATIARSLRGIDAVFHLAAAVGVGQSMYQVSRYTSTNCVGTAALLDALIAHRVERLIVASSMSIYGEGLYRSSDGQTVSGVERTLQQLQRGDWQLRDRHGEPLQPLPTPESATPTLSSVYALNKFDQERLCLMVGRAYGIPTVALRFFNVYGPRQALSNPYTGVLAIFASRLLNGNPPMIFEDGLQQRDFVSVHDIVQACRLSLTTPAADGLAINVGSGHPCTVAEIARLVGGVLGRDVPPLISGKFRVGDIRHCFADITLARQVLGYEPRVQLEDGLIELAEWLEGQNADDRVLEARAELEARGLTA